MENRIAINDNIAKLYSDIDKCIDDLIKARSNRDDKAEALVYSQMESLMVGTKQMLQYITDQLQIRNESDDLEEAVTQWRHKHFHGRRSFDGAVGEYLERTSQLDLAKYIANWQKQQMMKDAVEAEAVLNYYGKGDKEYYAVANEEVDGKKYNLHDGEKLKLIIIKED